MMLDHEEMARAASESDADAALQAMRQATQQLDEILQHMCAGRNPPSDAAADEEGEFADARECGLANQENDNASCAGVNGAREGKRTLLQHAGHESIEDYFKVIETALAGSVDLGSTVRLLNQPLCVGADGVLDQLLLTSDSRKLQRELFASLTRSMAFHFTQDSKLNNWSSSDNDSNGERSVSPPVAELEANMSYDLFVARLRHQMGAHDHLLPASKTNMIAHKVLSGLATQNATTINVIRTFFRESGIKDNNQAIDVHWQQGNSQTTQICVRETECDFQWGLQVSVTTSSLFRAQSKQSGGSHLESPLVSTTLQHSMSLPKSKYSNSEEDERTPSSISSTTNVYLMGQKDITSSTLDTDELQAGGGPENALSKPNSSVSSPESFASYSPDQSKRELPELLKVYVRGGFSDEMANDATPINQQSNNFVKLNIQTSYLIRDVLRAAKYYKLPSLEKLCRNALAEGAASSVYPLDGFDVGSSLRPGANKGKNASEQELRSLNVDLQFAFSDPTWSDLTLLTEGNREIPVHRCVLTARSEYFRALLGFQLKHGQQQQRQPHESKANMVMEVNESYAGMLRVLNFIYNDHVALPDAHNDNNEPQDDDDVENDDDDDDGAEQLLEDLIAADKYGLVRWKRLCEHAVRVNLANCLEVLTVADLVSATHLKQVALAFLQSNLPIVTSEPAFVKFKGDFPHLLEELFANIRMETTNETLLRNWHNAVETQLNLQREQEARDWKAKSEAAAKFPWLYLILAITFATLYLAVMSKQAHEYPFVPALNLVALLGFFCALFFGWI